MTRGNVPQAGDVHMVRKPRKNRVVILDDINFFFDEPELSLLGDMWNQNASLEYMAAYFERHQDEIFLALFHLARQGKIDRRRKGVF